ncbi:hypothetical protein Tco_0721637 [Tanacetum coccineum]
MHNNIMVVGLKDQPPMLATERYAQWRSRFLRYIDTKNNGEALRKCILEANERLQQGKSLNIQDVTTNLFWEFGKFTSRDGESIESYYSRIYKMMNEMIRNNLQVTTMQYQNEVNEIRAERIAKSENPLALVAAAQQYPKTYYQAPKSQRSNAPAPKQSFSIRSNASTRHKGKEIGKPVTPPSESDFDEDIDPEQAKKDKEMQKNWLSLQSILRSSTNLPTTTLEPFQTPDTRLWILFEVEQVDWLEDTDEEIDEQELEAHYSYMAKIQEVLPADSDTNAEPLAEDDSNVTPDSSNMCNNDNQVDQNATECDDERVALANLIANLKLDVDENKKIHKQLKKANASLTQEL